MEKAINSYHLPLSGAIKSLLASPPMFCQPAWQRDQALHYLTLQTEIKNGWANLAKGSGYIGPGERSPSHLSPITSLVGSQQLVSL